MPPLVRSPAATDAEHHDVAAAPAGGHPAPAGPHPGRSDHPDALRSAHGGPHGATASPAGNQTHNNDHERATTTFYNDNNCVFSAEKCRKN